MTDEPIEYLSWDTEFFGFPVGRITTDQLTPEIANYVDAWCKQNSIACLYFMANSNDSTTIQLVEDRGFHLVEIRLEIELKLKNWVPMQEPSWDRSLRIREAELNDFPELLDITQGSFLDSRYYVDPGFSKETCDAFYATWVKTSFGKDSELFVVAESDHQLQGYVICHPETPDKANMRLDLVAVRQGKRNSGVGKAMFQHVLNWCKQENVQYIWSATQGRNIASQRLFQRAGFLLRSCQLYYHKWYASPQL